MAVVIVGAGALGREVLATLRAAGQEVTGFLVEPGYPTTPVHQVPVRDDPAAWTAARGTRFLVAVGDGRERSRLVGRLAESLPRQVVPRRPRPYVILSEGVW
jgi:nucleoside-diphosphate-sugar epimerase